MNPLTFYWKLGILGGVVLAVASLMGYIWWLNSSLTAARSEIEKMSTEIDTLKGDLNNARTRNQIDDTVRRSDDPAGRLLERYSRPN